jgi:hypothetical protein
MDLSKAMRFCITQAQKEAAGNEVKTEHLFLGLLELDKPQQQGLSKDEVWEVRKILTKYGVHSGRSGDKLRELLRTERQSAEGDIPSLLADVIAVCKQQGKSEVSAASMLELILKSPTVLISQALNVKPQQKVTPRKDEPVFFNIPQPGGNPPSPPPRRKRRTKINGITFRGGTVWAAIQYFFLALAIPFVLLVFAEYQWQVLSASPSGTFMVSLPWLILFSGVWFICFGVVSLVRKKFRAFAGFLAFVSNTALTAFAVCVYMFISGFEAPPVSIRIIASVLTLGFLFISVSHLSQIKSSRDEVLNSSVLRLHGTPGVLFFSYLLRAMIIPIIAASIFWISGLPVNNVWKAIFFIYGFLLLYDAVYTTLKCLKIKFLLFTPIMSSRAVLTVLFLQLQCRLWFLPLLGWFLMWYFGWFPMATWAKWVYGIYFTLISIYSLVYLLSGEKK